MNMNYELYVVGGTVRDKILGVRSNDIDYSVVIDPGDIKATSEETYSAFVEQIKSEGFDIKVETPECLTVRALFPKFHKHSGVADFVIARREIYSPKSRTPTTIIGNLEDDLRRRDFTLNALAESIDGNIIDMFDGIEDLHFGVLNTPIDPVISFKDDPLRIIRAIRFSVTKGFVLGIGTRHAIIELGIQGMEKVSMERIKDEVNKAFKFSTKLTLETLNYYEDNLRFPIRSYIFDNTGLWAELTNKKR